MAPPAVRAITVLLCSAYVRWQELRERAGARRVDKFHLHEAQRVQLAQAAGRALLVRLARSARRLKHRRDERMQMPAAAARLLKKRCGAKRELSRQFWKPSPCERLSFQHETLPVLLSLALTLYLTLLSLERQERGFSSLEEATDSMENHRSPQFESKRLPSLVHLPLQLNPASLQEDTSPSTSQPSHLAHLRGVGAQRGQIGGLRVREGGGERGG